MRAWLQLDPCWPPSGVRWVPSAPSAQLLYFQSTASEAFNVNIVAQWQGVWPARDVSGGVATLKTR